MTLRYDWTCTVVLLQRARLRHLTHQRHDRGVDLIVLPAVQRHEVSADWERDDGSLPLSAIARWNDLFARFARAWIVMKRVQARRSRRRLNGSQVAHISIPIMFVNESQRTLSVDRRCRHRSPGRRGSIRCRAQGGSGSGVHPPPELTPILCCQGAIAVSVARPGPRRTCVVRRRPRRHGRPGALRDVHSRHPCSGAPQPRSRCRGVPPRVTAGCDTALIRRRSAVREVTCHGRETFGSELAAALLPEHWRRDSSAYNHHQTLIRRMHPSVLQLESRAVQCLGERCRRRHTITAT
mmetsp:Transcript_15705/g.38587  ORF Transcript_15705/g.38587 Transcript_15705/m.38587 type:complete len:295 (-) Transcript_15705:1287-2171(-)